MNLTLEAGVSGLAVFLQGLLSFFSPCVLPLVPLYLGYLAGGAKTTAPDGTVRYKRSKVMLNTLFFVLGISFAFFLLGLGFSAVGMFFAGYQSWFARISGILIILFGLYQVGFFEFKWLNRDFRLPFKLDKIAMNPLVALVLGFTFSFAWTPCVGPALASVLLMASGAKTAALAFGLISLYTLGFVLPFLAVGLFTSALLNFFKKHQNLVKYTAKAGGVLMILIGIMTLTGWMNGITGYLSRFGGIVGEAPAQSQSTPVQSQNTPSQSAPASETPKAPSSSAISAPSAAAPPAATPPPETQTFVAPNFTLTDQFGETHTLSGYKGKVVFLNFWATWCPPCRSEMPDIQALYEEQGGNAEDIIVLGVANPLTDQNTNTQEGSIEDVTAFLTENAYTYPTAMDTTGEVFAQYNVRSLPTTFMISTDGKVFGYIPGAITRDIMDSIIQQTLDGQAQSAATNSSAP